MSHTHTHTFWKLFIFKSKKEEKKIVRNRWIEMCRISKFMQSCKILHAVWARTVESWQNEKCTFIHSSNFLGVLSFFNPYILAAIKDMHDQQLSIHQRSNSFLFFSVALHFLHSFFQYISWHLFFIQMPWFNVIANRKKFALFFFSFHVRFRWRSSIFNESKVYVRKRTYTQSEKNTPQNKYNSYNSHDLTNFVLHTVWINPFKYIFTTFNMIRSITLQETRCGTHAIYVECIWHYHDSIFLIWFTYLIASVLNVHFDTMNFRILVVKRMFYSIKRCGWMNNFYWTRALSLNHMHKRCGHSGSEF